MSDRESLRKELLSRELWSAEEVTEFLRLSSIDEDKAKHEGFPQPMRQEGRHWWVRDDVVVWCQEQGGSSHVG
jgi:hypothetical protein